MSKHYTKKQRKRDDRIIMVIYGLVIVAFLSIIFMAWYAVFRTTRYYNIYTDFDTGQWAALVDSMTVHAKDRITFTLTCGMEIEE